MLPGVEVSNSLEMAFAHWGANLITWTTATTPASTKATVSKTLFILSMTAAKVSIEIILHSQ